ncbi:MAG: AarF/ABC1/UbiB kinase family protein [Rhodospirillales bacterium]|nr:MAG: AarF/ABC1/UbiB kinase family protein [Rhodospirillales bacterium]
MSEWLAFCDSLDLGAVVPERFERYRPAILHGIAHFLANLAPERTVEILAAQADLPEDAGPHERLVAIARQCPALHKLGQVLARDRRLPLQLRLLLQHLESMQASQPRTDIMAALERELGPLAALGITVDAGPIAEASVAVVVPVRWTDDAAHERRGVMKVLKPGIEARLEEELALLQQVGALLDDRCHQYGLPEIAYEATFARVRELLSLEVDLRREQAHLVRARADYAKLKTVIVPELHPFCTARLTAMERIDGRKVTEVASLTAKARRRLAHVIVEALIARPIWARGPDAMFHADPHAGNLLATDDGRIGILDWSLVGHLSKDDRVNLSQILTGAMTADPGAIVQAVTGLAGGAVDGAVLEKVVRTHLAGRGSRPWPGLSWLVDLMDDVVTKARAHFRADLLAFRKVLQTLEGVIADVSEECHPDVVLAASFLRRLALEWGSRMVSSPFSREFGTHLSNADLAYLLMFAPTAAWAQQVRVHLAGDDDPAA